MFNANCPSGLEYLSHSYFFLSSVYFLNIYFGIHFEVFVMICGAGISIFIRFFSCYSQPRERGKSAQNYGEKCLFGFTPMGLT